MLLHHHIAHIVEAGTDEAGRGPLAGSVFAAAVILPAIHFSEKDCADVDFSTPFAAGDYRWMSLLNDSKQLNEEQRYILRDYILRDAISYAVTEVTAEEIDDINILNASILGMHRSLAQLNPQPTHILVDGNKFKPYSQDTFSPLVPHKTVVKGDGKYMSIAAASILAKTYRDDYMLRLHAEFPQYGWDKNKGYPTRQHRLAVLQHGLTPYHRKTFVCKNNDISEKHSSEEKKNNKVDTPPKKRTKKV